MRENNARDSEAVRIIMETNVQKVGESKTEKEQNIDRWNKK